MSYNIHTKVIKMAEEEILDEEEASEEEHPEESKEKSIWDMDLDKYFELLIGEWMVDVDENNMRIIFRPTQIQYDRVQKLMTTGRYRTQSELLRQILNIGLDKLGG